MSKKSNNTPPERLYFAYTQTPPPLDRFDVKRVVRAELLGHAATFVVIGESHYIGCRRLGFHELCSCRPLPAEPMHSVSLTSTGQQTFAFENEWLSASTTLEARPLADRPDEQATDVAYRFGPDAWTMIVVDTESYETYHSYPEYERTLYTRTRLTERTNTD